MDRKRLGPRRHLDAGSTDRDLTFRLAPLGLDLSLPYELPVVHGVSFALLGEIYTTCVSNFANVGKTSRAPPAS